MKALPNFASPLINRNPSQRAINLFFRASPSAFPAAALSHELAEHLLNKDFIERNFFVVADLHDYGRWFYKTLVVGHVLLVTAKLQAEGLHATARYFDFYFQKMHLPRIFEETMYPNVHFHDFKHHFMTEFDHLFLRMEDDPTAAGFLDADLAARYGRYMTAHRNYLAGLTLQALLTQRVDYGFIDRLE